MKSVLFSRFFILLPWVLIVIIMIDIDSKRTIRAPAAARTGRAQRAARTGAPGVGVTPNQTALPVIYAITPTYYRPVQKAELTRLAHAFRQVPRFHWVVVEDSTTRTELVARFLARCGVPFTHLHVFTPGRFKRTGMPRATEQRNAALAWLRQHRSLRDPGVVFFADDSLELFEEVTGHELC
ncbi:galactosylgalactosylxylosylprotein 3-beta-glucuronosyltransferase 2-like [Pleuronectes platessa]|uniref:galactosylgalactosylxylosylprotein 3-beta-glucuronosyltransferase 2-like n=1 Tax=Pleuronectes platessa TaxID=8262 RepID=UPI00232A6E90|nr:galactosylgalactosylxylosylprotein 3-beta-glucuronosyltransferase 2-like [Pleuronectes platessa]